MTLLDGQSEVFRIYKFTNTTNFKMYIGITAMTLEQRSADGVANITEAQRKRWSDPAQRQAARDKSLAAWARKKGGDHAVA